MPVSQGPPPTRDEVLVAADDKVEEAAPEDGRRAQERVVRAVQHAARQREAVEDERGADGLLGQRREAHGRDGGGRDENLLDRN